jgi:integrase/recombinase XerD
MQFYSNTAGKFAWWLASHGVIDPQEVTAWHVRRYLAELVERGLKDTSTHDHARAIKTLLRFWHVEGYKSELVTFPMPRLEKKRLPVLTVEQLQTIIKACNIRDRAIVLLMADSGLRRAEVCRLNWPDVDMQTGLVRVRMGKGKKDRSAVIGAKCRRALLSYRRTMLDRGGALFQTRTGARMTGAALLLMFRRLSKRTGTHVTAHALRRTFAILAIRAGMNPLHLQALGGWADMKMVQHYTQMVDDDLLEEHKAHSPIDKFFE